MTKPEQSKPAGSRRRRRRARPGTASATLYDLVEAEARVRRVGEEVAAPTGRSTTRRRRSSRQRSTSAGALRRRPAQRQRPGVPPGGGVAAVTGDGDRRGLRVDRHVLSCSLDVSCVEAVAAELGSRWCRARRRTREARWWRRGRPARASSPRGCRGLRGVFDAARRAGLRRRESRRQRLQRASVRSRNC